MKVIYLSSGFQGIYDHIDQVIINAIKLKHDCQSVSLFGGIDNIKSTIEEFNPVLVLTTVGYTFPPQLRNWIQNKGIPIALWLTEDPYYIDLTLPIIHKFNYIFTIDKAAYNRYRIDNHKQVHLLSIGTDINVYRKKEKNSKYSSDICFIGSPYPNRIETMKFLLSNTNYEIFIAGAEWQRVLSQYVGRTKLKLANWVPPELSSHYFSNAKINLNIQRPFDLDVNSNTLGIIPQSVNNRTFDIAACGAFQIILSPTDLDIPFQEDKLNILVNSNDNLLKKIKFYLSNEKERKAIALRNQEIVLNHYTINHCIDIILDKIAGNNDIRTF